MLLTKAFFDDSTHTVTYLVWDEVSTDAMIIDPVLDYEPHGARISTQSADIILDVIKDIGLNLKWILDTHVHADHLSAGHYMREKTGAKLGISANIKQVQKTFQPLFLIEGEQLNSDLFDCYFKDKDSFLLGSHKVMVMETPGHTNACLTYIVGNMAFVGDTLFMPDYGTARADFPGGDAGVLYSSIQRILSLPDDMKIMTGHDYLTESRKVHQWESTVAAQKMNVHINGKTKDQYVDMRNKRDANLSAPRLILPALQVNVRGGALPTPAKDGHIYLTIPINRL